MQATFIKHRIALVDDNEDLLHQAQFWLSKKGFSTLTFKHSEPLLTSLPFCDVDLVLIDVHLKNEDGCEVCSKVRKTGFTKPVVLFSFRDYSTLDLSCYGATAFIHKPYDYISLAAALTSYLETPAGLV